MANADVCARLQIVSLSIYSRKWNERKVFDFRAFLLARNDAKKRKVHTHTHTRTRCMHRNWFGVRASLEGAAMQI